MKKTANIWEYKVCVFVKNSISDLYTVYFYKLFIDGSNGAIGMHAPSHSNFFHFHAVFGKKCAKCRLAHPFLGLALEVSFGKSWIRYCL